MEDINEDIRGHVPQGATSRNFFQRHQKARYNVIPRKRDVSRNHFVHWTIKKHPCECECLRQKRNQEEQDREQRRHDAVVRELKEHCFSDPSMREWTFENDKGFSGNTVLAKLYVKDWETMKAENTRYIFWGTVGTGKKYLAGCIANALLEQEIEVRMNNFAEVLNDLTAHFSEKSICIKNLYGYPLLILDDLGMERGTEGGFYISVQRRRDRQTVYFPGYCQGVQ